MDQAAYTAIFGGYDKLQTPTVPGRFVAYTGGQMCEGWEVWTSIPQTDRRRTARQFKLLSFPAAESLWIDGNIALAVPVAEVLGAWLDGYDLALFKHPAGDCIYGEARRVVKKGKDAAEVVDAQMERYRADGFPAHFGLGETCIMAKRDTPAVREFMALWWAEIVKGSARDQLSFDYVRWLMGDKVRVNPINGGMGWRRRSHPWFVCREHGA
ncbi:MAG: glycosyltransferase domain-containing protein [Planctomycetaceae bacterium]